MNLNKTKAKAKTKSKPEDLIAPRVLVAGKTITFSGKYGVERAELLLHWLVHMAAGKPFLGMTSPRPLRVFYLHTEYTDPYLKKLMQSTQLDPELIQLSKPNLSVSASIDTIDKLRKEILCAFGDEKVDVIVIDTDNKIFAADLELVCFRDMKNFARDKLDVLREAVNSNCGIILVQYLMINAEMAERNTCLEVLHSSFCCDVYMGMNGFHPTPRTLHLRERVKTGRCRVIDKIDGSWVQVRSVAPRCRKKAQA